ncbi:unnamed protein product [Clonostachys solani]|uniref:Calcium-binding protein n=1 Tax=Clonostachys solani TaxID=160281 RepID=A0A9N9YRJ8_9HYPO|nr:unnamed protein product [Clonostachys solani]
MAADSSVEASALQLNLTHDEKQFYGQLFRQADTGGAGVVTGDVAVTFFEKTRLDSRVLGEIWQIADKENRGFLTPAGFSIVLRLIGHAQAGREPTPTLALEPGQLPRFDGIVVPTVGSPPPPAAIQPQGSGGVRIPPLTPEKVAQYTGLFERQPLQGGTLPGDQAKQIFEKSGLPNEILGRIWMLADTEQRGALVQAEFIIAMHLLTSLKTGSLRALPTVLPAALYEAATRRGSPVAPRQSPQSTGVSASVIPRQLSGTQARVGSPLGRPPIGPQGTGNNWAVTPGDKVKFDHIFTDLDKTNKGFITGEEAVPFLKQSGLAEDALAQIWDLADINSHGQLIRDEFAVAMFLIRQQRGNRSAPLPSSLPPNLIPPSLRNRQPAQAQSAFQAPTPPQPPPPAPKSALDDLFGLESSPSPVPDQSAAGSTASDPFAGGVPSSPTSKTVSSGVSFKPFVPSSSFGRGLTKQPTGDSTPSSSQQATQFGDDLLGDTDPDISKKLTGETTELANLSNQIGSLSKQMQDTQAKRTNTQNELNQANSQKQNFEQRLSQLRTLYEKEVQDARALEEQLRTARADTQKLQSECMILEGTYKDVQTQHQETLSSLQVDQQENANLRERIRAVNGEIAQLKPQIEKLKSEARQQKGLVAINKKQLSTNENERDKLKAEAEELTKSNEELSRQINTGSPASTTAKVASPALSTASGNNPFFNRTASTDIMGAFAPPSRTFSDTAFDDVFGPSAPVGSSATPPPPTSFKRQHTGNSAVSFSSAPNGSPTMSRQATLAEPPAPPESRQITSSNLPLPQHSESLTSSRQVSPPASRAEGSLNDISFPTDTASSAALPGAFPADDSDKADIPGGPPAATSEEAGNKASDEPSDAPKSSDVFANTDQAKAKAEFDNAFAAFASAKSTSPDTTAFEPAKTKSVFNTEFPPISSLEKDDESDSESDEGGFDDDFAPRSPPQKLKAADTSSAPTSEGTKVDGAVSAAGQAKETHEQPSSPTTPTAPAATGTTQQHSSIDDIFGKAEPAPPAAAKQPTPSNPSGKGAFDESEDDFEGLEEAKEGSGYEDFADVSRSGLEDFNPVFDSSPPGSQAKSESFGNGSSFDFISTSSAPGVTAPTAVPSATAQQKTADSHDWDAIFAGLDSEPAAAPAANDLLSDKADGLAIPERPGVGRALTEGGEHDDPIVKDLVGMGYARKDAVNALEKYNYNLEKAANHLASQS